MRSDRGSFWGNDNVLKLDYSDGCTALKQVNLVAHKASEQSCLF